MLQGHAKPLIERHFLALAGIVTTFYPYLEPTPCRLVQGRHFTFVVRRCESVRCSDATCGACCEMPHPAVASAGETEGVVTGALRLPSAPRSTIRRTGRDKTPSMPVSSSEL